MSNAGGVPWGGRGEGVEVGDAVTLGVTVTTVGVGRGVEVGAAGLHSAHYTAARNYMSICRICDSCMLVCQTSSKKFK